MKLKIAKIVFSLCVNIMLFSMLYDSAMKDDVISDGDKLSIVGIMLLLNSLAWSLIVMLNTILDKD